MTLTLVLFALVSCAAVLVQSVVGFAGALLAVPLLCLFLPPAEAVPAYNMVMLVVDLFLVYECRKSIRWGRLRGLLPAGLAAVPMGAFFLKHLPMRWVGVGICVVTLAFAIVFLLNIHVAMNERMPTQIGIGFLSGLLGGAISTSGPPIVVYGLALGWNKEAFRSTLLAYFACLCLLANVCYWSYGMVTRRAVLGFGVAVAPALLISTFGVRLKNIVTEAGFRRIVLFVIVGVSLIGIVRHLHA